MNKKIVSQNSSLRNNSSALSVSVRRRFFVWAMSLSRLFKSIHFDYKQDAFSHHKVLLAYCFRNYKGTGCEKPLIESLCGGGSEAYVLKVRVLGDVCVVKLDTDSLLKTEGQALFDLRHYNELKTPADRFRKERSVQILSLGNLKDMCFYAMKYYSGGTLSSRIDSAYKNIHERRPLLSCVVANIRDLLLVQLETLQRSKSRASVKQSDQRFHRKLEERYRYFLSKKGPFTQNLESCGFSRDDLWSQVVAAKKAVDLLLRGIKAPLLYAPLIHGDLTTTNVVFDSEDTLFYVDCRENSVAEPVINDFQKLVFGIYHQGVLLEHFKWDDEGQTLDQKSCDRLSYYSSFREALIQELNLDPKFQLFQKAEPDWEKWVRVYAGCQHFSDALYAFQDYYSHRAVNALLDPVSFEKLYNRFRLELLLFYTSISGVHPNDNFSFDMESGGVLPCFASLISPRSSCAK